MEIHELSARTILADTDVFAVDTGSVTNKTTLATLESEILASNHKIIPLYVSGGIVMINTSGSIQYTANADDAITQYAYVDMYFCAQGGLLQCARIWPNNGSNTKFKIGFIAQNATDGDPRLISCYFEVAGRYFTNVITKFATANGTYSTNDTILTLYRVVGWKS